MPKLDLDFRWHVPKAGYRWEDGEWLPQGAEVIIDSLLVEALDRERARRPYAPLAVSGLFREFADVQPSKEGILAFANKYGALGVGTFFTTGSGSQEAQILGRLGETQARWAAEIARMKEAVTLLDLVRARDEAGLARVLRWREARVDGLFPVWPESWAYEGAGHSVPLTGYAPSNIFAPAIGLVMAWANEKLQGRTTLQLADDEEGRPLLTVRLNTLLTALWVQLAQDVVQPAEYRRCKTCGRWFAVPDDRRKADQVFCQDACKSKDFRQRKARAQQLAAEGKTAKAIAEEVQTDVATVKKWVSRKGR
jgi:hypothetical protein